MMNKSIAIKKIGLNVSQIKLNSTLNLEVIALIFPALVFFFNPIIGIIFAIVSASIYKSNLSIINVIILISFILGFINTTKIPESDMLTYSESYNYAKTTSFFNFLDAFGKEPVYYIAMYVFGGLLNAEFKLFVFLQTALAYSLFLYSIFKFYIKVSGRINLAIFALLVGSLFFELFSLSAHLMRQFLASSILLFCIVNYCLYKKNNWFLLGISAFIHSTIFFFLPFIFTSSFKQKLEVKKLILPIILVITVVYYLEDLVMYLSSNTPSYFEFIFVRLIEGDFKDLTGDINQGMLITNIISLAFACCSYAILSIRNVHNNGLYHFLNIFLALILFTLLTIDSPLISYRFSFYAYFFFPFIFPLLLQFVPVKAITIIIQFIVISVLLYRFGYKLDHGSFTYESVEDLLFRSGFHYFFI